MNELDKFERKKARVFKALDALEAIVQQFQSEPLAAAIRASRENLKNEKFTIVVVGEFSRGKSTFINALLGDKVLPMKSRPTTTLLNRISYGEDKAYALHYEDKKKAPEILKEQDFNELIAPMDPIDEDAASLKEYEEKTKQLEQIEYVNISYPSVWCKNEVELLDTPGTNDLEQMREDITFGIIPQSDVAIMLLSAVQPLSKSEFEFLKTRILDEAHIQKIFFVANFKDELLTEEDVQKSYSYIYKHLKTIISNPKVHVVSAKDDLNGKLMQRGEKFRKKPRLSLEDTGVPELENGLRSFLAKDRGAVKLSKPIQHIQSYAGEINSMLIQVALGALDQPIEELQRKIADIEGKVKNIKKSRDTMIRELKENMRESEKVLRERMEVRFQTVAQSAEASLNHYEGNFNVQEIGEKVNQVTLPQMNRIQSEFRKEQENIIYDELARLGRKFEGEWDKLIDTVQEHFSTTEEEQEHNAFVTGGNLQMEENVIKASSFGTLGFAGLVGIAGVSFIFALPLAIVGGFKLFEHLTENQEHKRLQIVKSQVRQHFLKNGNSALKKVDKEWKKQEQLLEKHIRKEMDRKIGTLESQLAVILSDRKKQEHNKEQRKQELLTLQAELAAITNEMNELYHEIRKDSSITVLNEEVS